MTAEYTVYSAPDADQLRWLNGQVVQASGHEDAVLVRLLPTLPSLSLGGTFMVSGPNAERAGALELREITVRATGFEVVDA